METDKRIKLDLEENILDHIPVEIFLKIFSYLEGEDIKNIKLVCKHWYEIAQASEIGLKLSLQLVQIISNSTLEKFNFLQFSSQKFYNIKLKRCQIDYLVPLFEIIGNNTRILNIQESLLSSDHVLENILNVTRNIETLRLIYCSFNQCSIPKFRKAFRNIKVLEIVNKPTTKTKYMEVVNIIHSIDENILTSFSLNYVYKVFRELNAKSLLHLANMIRRNNKTLKKLNLFDCCFVEEMISGQLWELLSNQECDLESLSVSHIAPNVGSEKFMKFLLLQKNLRCLFLSHVRSLNDTEMATIINNLKELQELDLTNCISLTNKGIIMLAQLEKLETLNIIYDTEFITIHKVSIDSLIQCIAHSKNQKLMNLSLCNIKMEIEDLHELLKYLPNLRGLKCHSVSMVIHDESLEILKILANCKFLEDISFVNYKKNRLKKPVEPNTLCNNAIKSLEISYSETCRELLSAIRLPNLQKLKIFYHDDTRQKDNGKEFIRILYESSKSVEKIRLTVMSDIDYILDFILTDFKKLKSLLFIWHCENCLLFQRIDIKTNQKLHPLLKNSTPGNFQFDESCDRCNRLFSKLIS